jgi:hypothetical protein
VSEFWEVDPIDYVTTCREIRDVTRTDPDNVVKRASKLPAQFPGICGCEWLGCWGHVKTTPLGV